MESYEEIEMDVVSVALVVENKEEPMLEQQEIVQPAEPTGWIGATRLWFIHRRKWLAIAGVMVVALGLGAFIYCAIDHDWLGRDRRGLIPEDGTNPEEDSDFGAVVIDG